MAWILRAEFEYLLCLTSERLDVAKSRALLHAALDARLLLTDDPLYNAYIDAGKAALKNYLGEGKDRQGLGWQSRTFQAAMMACICDDVNLAHVFNVLRVEELLENLGDELSPSQCAKVMLAIIGEFLPPFGGACCCILSNQKWQHRRDSNIALDNKPRPMTLLREQSINLQAGFHIMCAVL